MEFSHLIILTIIFFTVALLYSSVGFGGGSSYAAALAITAIPYLFIPQIALICNIIVVTGGSWIFFREGHLKIKKVLPVIITSIPMAYIGGQVHLNKTTYLTSLGIFLFISSLSLIKSSIKKKNDAKNNEIEKPTPVEGSNKKYPSLITAFIGSLIGFVSGMIGIGGGILLSPVLHIVSWENPRTISSAASFFILVNSIAGLAGQVTKTTSWPPYEIVAPLAIAVLLGGQIGSRLGAIYLPEYLIKRGTGILVMVVSIKILSDQIF